MSSSNHGYRGADSVGATIENDVDRRRNAAMRELTNADTTSLKGRQQMQFPILKTRPATVDASELAVAARVTAPDARPRRLTSTLLWTAQIALAAFFLLFASLPKLVGGGSHGAVQEFGLIGAGQWFRYFVGTVELAGAIGLLTPWLAGFAAAGLAADMAGATIVNATVLHNTRYDAFWLTALLFVAFVILAYGRRQQIKRLAAAIRR